MMLSTLIGETIVTSLTLKRGLASPILQEKISALHSMSWNRMEKSTSMKQRTEVPHSYARKHMGWVQEKPAWRERLPTVIKCRMQKWEPVSKAPIWSAGRCEASSGQHRLWNGPTIPDTMWVHPGAVNHLVYQESWVECYFLSVGILAGNGWLQHEPAVFSPCPPSKYPVFQLPQTTTTLVLVHVLFLPLCGTCSLCPKCFHL